MVMKLGRPLTGEQKEGLIKFIESKKGLEGEVDADAENDDFAAHNDGEEILVLKPDLAELIKASQKINVMLQRFLEYESKKSERRPG
jgi:ABC-type uncharacterized transport system ATPase subunit